MNVPHLRPTAATATACLLVGSALGLLTSSPAQAAYPGEPGRIFFQSDRDGAPHLYSMNSDGSRLAQLTTSATNISPALSPDGTRIAFIRAGDVWTMDIDGTGLEPVTADSRDRADARCGRPMRAASPTS